MQAIGNKAIANSPDFSARGGGENIAEPTGEEISELDKAMDAAGVVDKPVEQVEKDLSDKMAGKTKATVTPAVEPAVTPAAPDLEKKDVMPPDAGRKIEPTKTDPAATVTPTVVTPPAATVTPPAPAKDDEIDNIQEPRGLNPANSENWKKLRETARKYKTDNSQLNTKYAEAVTTINKLYKEKEKLPEPIEKELTELRTFRKTFDYQEDADFKAKFQKPIDDTTEEISKILAANGITEEEIKEIKRVGVDKVDKKAWDATIDALMNDESQKARKLTPNQIQKEREAGIMLRKLLNKHEEQALDKRNEVEKLSMGQSDWAKNKEKTQAEEMTKEVTYVKDGLDKLQKDYPILQKIQAPADATPEQKTAAEEYNQHIDTVHKQFVVSYRPANTEQRFDTAMKAAYALIADRELIKATAANSQLTEQLKTVTQELESIKNSTRMTDPVGSGKEEQGKTRPKNVEDYVGMKSEDAVEQAMQNAGL